MKKFGDYQRSFKWPPQRFRLNRYSPQAKGLVGWWPLVDGGGSTARDYSGRGADGALQNMESSDWKLGRYGRYLTGDGVDEYVQLSSAPTITGDLTASCWIRTSTAATFRGIFGFYDASSPFPGWGTIVGTASGAGYHGFWSKGASTPGWKSSNSTFNDGEWHHLACVLIGTTVYFYLDGLPDGSDTTVVPGSYTGQKALFSREDGANNVAADGFDFRIYDRGLTAAEVWSLYNPPTRWELREPTNRLTYSYSSGAAPPAFGGVSRIIGGGISV